ncbi:hypothetical protein LXL04_000820 [Taraxacum kok-saghyz]
MEAMAKQQAPTKVASDEGGAEIGGWRRRRKQQTSEEAASAKDKGDRRKQQCRSRNLGAGNFSNGEKGSDRRRTGEKTVWGCENEKWLNPKILGFYMV